MSLFKSIEAEKDLILGELEFDHQSESVKMRANPDNKVTLGMLLDKTFDIQKEELGDMYVVSNYFEMNGKLIQNEDEIWNFDLSSPLLWHKDDEYSLKFGEHVELIIAYKRNKDENYKGSNDLIIVHLRDAGGLLFSSKQGKDTFYICATICIPPFAYEKQRVAITGVAVTEYECLQEKTLSVTIAFDTTSPEQKLAEYRYMKDDALDKIKNNDSDNLTDIQRFLVGNIFENIGKDFYFGKKAMEEKYYLEAIGYFSIVYNELQDRLINQTITNEEYDLFFESCYCLGFCYCDMKLFEKAFYYLDIVWSFNNVRDKMEYINCLVNKMDFRASGTISRELDRLSKIRRLEWTKDFTYYYHFLKRRMAYVYIDMNRFDEAENIFKEMLNDEMNKDFALSGLAYIQKIREQQKNN